jgi:hypothetical protein
MGRAARLLVEGRARDGRAAATAREQSEDVRRCGEGGRGAGADGGAATEGGRAGGRRHKDERMTSEREKLR